jgi:hypothetical protein
MRAGAGWARGTTGPVTVLASVCITFAGGAVMPLFGFEPPYPRSRTNAQEIVHFRYQLHRFANRDAAALGALSEELSPGSMAAYAVYESGWWYTRVMRSGNSFESIVFGQGLPWADSKTRQIPFALSTAKRLQLPTNASWVATLDVYWQPNGALGYGWYRQVVPMSGGYSCGG